MLPILEISDDFLRCRGQCFELCDADVAPGAAIDPSGPWPAAGGLEPDVLDADCAHLVSPGGFGFRCLGVGHLADGAGALAHATCGVSHWRCGCHAGDLAGIGQPFA